MKKTKQQKDRMSRLQTGRQWYTNGKTEIKTYTCPDGFKKGRLKSSVPRLSGKNHPNYGKKVWNSGLTKETDPRLAAIGKKISKTKSYS